MTQVRSKVVLAPSGATTLDVTFGTGKDTTTGVVVQGSQATSLDSADAHYSIGMGVSDFTDESFHCATDEDGQGATDNSRIHQSTDIFRWYTPGTGTVIRTISAVTAISNGVRLTFGESGTQFYLKVTCVFGGACKAAAVASGGSENDTVQLAHGLTGVKFGWVAFNNQLNSSAILLNMSVGFFSNDGSIKQCSFGHRQNDALGTTAINGRVDASYVGQMNNNSGGNFHAIAITGIDGTNVDLQTKLGGAGGAITILCVEGSDVSADAIIIDSPTAAGSDWNMTDLSFQPDHIDILLNRADVATSGGVTDERAGSFYLYSQDSEGNIGLIGAAVEDAIVLGTTNCQSYASQTKLFMSDDDGTTSHDMDGLVFDATGWDVANADIDSADGTARKWPMLAIGAPPTPIVIPVPVGPEY